MTPDHAAWSPLGGPCICPIHRAENERYLERGGSVTSATQITQREPVTQASNTFLFWLGAVLDPLGPTQELTAKVQQHLARIENEAAAASREEVERLRTAAQAVANYPWGIHLAGTPQEQRAIALIETLRRALATGEQPNE